ncbi:MAG: fatty acid--CoA ligase [Caulobacterales bacterium]
MGAAPFTQMRSLADVSRVQARERPDKPALVFEGRVTTFGAFDRHTNQVGHGLIAAGVQPQSHISYLGKNSDHYYELVIGAAKANAIMTPVNWRLAGPEIVYILNDARASVLFVGGEFVGLIKDLLPELPHLKLIVAMESPPPEWPGYEQWRDAQNPQDTGIQPGWDDVALQLYTSGTTGRPKGAMLMTRSLFALRQLHNETGGPWQRWTDEDVSLVAMPCFHIGGTGWGLTGLVYGATGVVMREFDPTKVLDFFVEYSVSKLFLVPAAMQIVLRQANARDVDYSRLKNMLYGASPIPLDLLREAIEVFGCGFVQMYGMTETTGTIVALPPEDHHLAGSPKMRSAGKALPGIEIKIIDEKGEEVVPGEVGEIATRSEMNMKGYWNLPEATAQTLGPDGWLRTGDAGYMDEDGYVYIHDRVKDMIISGGENIYPAEVESAIYSHPAVADVAVIGVPDEKWGEAVKAMVVLKPGAAATEQDIMTFARTQIAAFKCPKSVDFIETLPRNPSGKILRRELRAPFWEGRVRQVN